MYNVCVCVVKKKRKKKRVNKKNLSKLTIVVTVKIRKIKQSIVKFAKYTMIEM